MDLPRVKTTLQYFGKGVLLGLPYYAINEITTGFINRRYGREQFFLSHTASAVLTYIGMVAWLGYKKNSIFAFSQ